MHRNIADMELPIHGSIEQIIKKAIRIRNKSVGSHFIVRMYVHALISKRNETNQLFTNFVCVCVSVRSENL